ncbi:MAG: FAD-dependent oxidoreductase [Candidatus Omnitrophota bacterium]
MRVVGQDGRARAQMSGKKRVIIVGAGLSGLSAGISLRRNKVDFLILEKEMEPGGLCRSKKRGGFIFDYDGHLLHFKTAAGFKIVNGLLKGEMARFSRDASVSFRGFDVPYPFQANLHALPESLRLECVRGLKNRDRSLCQGDFSSWIQAKFGAGIARHFMLPYNRKFWRYPLNRMTSSWTGSFIPVPSSKKMLSGASRAIKEPLGYNSSFWYPAAGGIDVLPRRMAGACGNILYGRHVSGIDRERRVVRTARGEEFVYDKLISTMPLPDLGNICSGFTREVRKSFRSLRWNSLVVFNIGFNGGPFNSRHWIYFPGKDVPFFRVGFPHTFSSCAAPRGWGSLYAEVSYAPGRKPDVKRLRRELLDGLYRTGIFTERSRICAEDILNIQYAYPVYDHAYTASHKLITSCLREDGVILCGRYGGWNYFSMEDSILDGMSAAERAVKNA